MSHPFKRHLDRFSRFSKTHKRDQQTDSPTDTHTDQPRYSVCSSRPLSLAIDAIFLLISKSVYFCTTSATLLDALSYAQEKHSAMNDKDAVTRNSQVETWSFEAAPSPNIHSVENSKLRQDIDMKPCSVSFGVKTRVSRCLVSQCSTVVLTLLLMVKTGEFIPKCKGDRAIGYR